MRWAHRLLGFVFAALCAFPMLTFIGHLCGVPLMTVYALAAPGLAIASVLSAIFPRRYRVIGIIVLLLINIAAAVYLFPSGWLAVLVVLAMAISQIVTLGASANFDENPVTIKEFGFGAALYGISYALMFLQGDHSHLQMMGIACVIYLVYGVILINLNAVSDVTRVARRVEARLPATLRVGNLLLTLLFIGVALVLVNIVPIKDAFMAAVGNILLFILWLASLGAGEDSGAGEEEGSGSGMQELFGEEAKHMPEWLEAILNVILYVLTAAALIAVAVLACVAIYRLMKKLIAFIRKWLGAQGREASGGMGYTDERTKLTRWQTADGDDEPKKSWLERLTHRLPKWKDLDDRARVRYALQNIMYPERNSDADRTRTAREIMEGTSVMRRGGGDPDGFADAYNRARYSREEIMPADAENARRFVRGEK